MTATALIKFTQGPNTDIPGRAVIGTRFPVDGSVVVTNGNNTNVVEWEIWICDAPPESITYPPGGFQNFVGGRQLVLLASATNNTPTASFAPDVDHSYRILLIVRDASGIEDRDIRDFGIPNTNGFICPPYQTFPEPIPVLGSGLPGAKPDEMNFNGQVRGYAGPATIPKLVDGLLKGIVTAIRTIAVLTITNPNSIQALTAGIMQEGTIAFAATNRSYYRLDKTLALVPSGLDIIAGASGTNWVRLPIADLSWLTQAAWYVDPSAGNDENDGSILNPLASVYEARLRALGSGARLKQSTSLNIVSNPLASDRIKLDVDLAPGDSFTLNGVITPILSGTIDSVTNYDGINQALEITETGHGSWAAQESVRIALSSGPDIDKVAWILKNLDPGVPDTARCAFFTNDVVGGVVEPTATTGYELEILPEVTISTIKVTGGAFFMQNIRISQVESWKLSVDGVATIFGCDLSGAGFLPTGVSLSDSLAFIVGCRVNYMTFSGSPGIIFQACAGFGNAFFGSIINIDSIFLIRSTMIQGAPLSLQPTALTHLGTFEPHTQIEEDTVGGGLGIFDSTTDALSLGLGGTIRCLGNGRIWGSGNAGYAIRMNGKMTYDAVTAKPTIVGGGPADTRIGGSDNNYGGLPFFNANNGAMIVEEPT